MSAIDHLLKLAHAYSDATKKPLVTVSWRAFGDSKKLAALESGLDIQVKRYESAMRWFADNWPVEAVWPEGVPYPAPLPAESDKTSHGAAA